MKEEMHALVHNVFKERYSRRRSSASARNRMSKLGIGVQNDKLKKENKDLKEYVGALAMLLIALLVILGLFYVANVNLHDRIIFLEQQVR